MSRTSPPDWLEPDARGTRETGRAAEAYTRYGHIWLKEDEGCAPVGRRQSTQIYAHIAHDPAWLAADRATTGIAKALGRSVPMSPVSEPTPDAGAIAAALAANGRSSAELVQALAAALNGEACLEPNRTSCRWRGRDRHGHQPSRRTRL